MITCAGYKMVYLNPDYDPVKENQICENSNTESCEEEFSKNSKNIAEKPKITAKMSAADTLWRRRLEENANKTLVEQKEVETENPDRPVIPLTDKEVPEKSRAIKYQSGREFDILYELLGEVSTDK